MSKSLHSYKGKIESQKTELVWLSLGHMSDLVQSVKTKKAKSQEANIAARGPCVQVEEEGLFSKKGEVRRVLL